MSRHLKKKVQPVVIDGNPDVATLLNRMSGTGFQGRALGRALGVWQRMLSGNTVVLFGLAGAMVPAGMRRVIVSLIENRLIDCLVSTGANLFHDIHETLGKFHWQGSALANDLELREEKLNRIYDVLAIETEFDATDYFICQFGRSLDRSRAYPTREFLYLLGRHLDKHKKEEGILTAASRANLPIYCPAIGDSSISIALAALPPDDNVLFDTVRDVQETAFIVEQAPETGVIFIGGGTPKNFIQQTEVTVSVLKRTMKGHQYALQITADSPQWGGLSGCTLEEAQSWGKISDEADKVNVNCDATIALPLLAAAVLQANGGNAPERPPVEMAVRADTVNESINDSLRITAKARLPGAHELCQGDDG